MRLKGKDGISKVSTLPPSASASLWPGASIKKTQKTPHREIELALKWARRFGHDQNERTSPDVDKKRLPLGLRKTPPSVLARAVIQSRITAGLTQEQLTERMETAGISTCDSSLGGLAQQTLRELGCVGGLLGFSAHFPPDSGGDAHEQGTEKNNGCRLGHWRHLSEYWPNPQSQWCRRCKWS